MFFIDFFTDLTYYSYIVTISVKEKIIMSSLGNKEIMARNIRYYMDKYGVDRNTICDKLNIKYTTFSDWVNAKTYPRIDKIEKLATYFGISKSDLVESREIHSDFNSEYYIDPSVNIKAEYARTQEGILLDAAKDLSDEDLDYVIDLVNRLRGGK